MPEKPSKQPFRFPALDLVIWAENEEEAKKLLKGVDPEKSKTPKLKHDLNGDGEFNVVDSSIAGEVLNESKKLKK